jgi:hypothetical protein
MKCYERESEKDHRESSAHISQQQISFKSTVGDFIPPEKKPPKEYLSVEGILKQNWLLKYYESIPSVVVFFVSFNCDWNATEWTRRETAFTEKYSRLKAVLSAREVKVITVMIKIGSGLLEKDIFDERLSTLKRHCQFDNKTFFFFSSSDFFSETSNLKRVVKYLREFSSSFYTFQIKKFKNSEKSLSSDKYTNKNTSYEAILRARLNFKIAFLNEFSSQFTYCLKHYRQAYYALASSIDNIDEEMFDQVKAVAEMAHFKICNHLLTSYNANTTSSTSSSSNPNSNVITASPNSSLLEEAFLQFKNHISTFTKLYSSSRQTWRHYGWIASQYLVFSQLLDTYRIVDPYDSSVSSASPASFSSSLSPLPLSDRAFYFENVARFTKRRKEAFSAIREEVLRKKLSTNTLQEFRGLLIMPSRYIGSTPLFLNPKFDQLYSSEESTKIFLEYCAELELSVDYNNMILLYLNNAVERTNTAFQRKIGFFLLQIAEFNLENKNFSAALPLLWKYVNLLVNEKWVFPSCSVAKSLLQCSLYLGKVDDYLKASFLLYSNAVQIKLSSSELEKLHFNIFSIFSAHFSHDNIPKISKFFNELPSSRFSSSSSLTSIISSIDFGSVSEGNKCGSQGAAFLELRDHYSLNLRNSLFSMFDISVSFDKHQVTFGDTLTITLTVTSFFLDTLIPDQMILYFIDNSLTYSFSHTFSEAENDYTKNTAVTSEPRKVNLCFQPSSPKIFTILVDVNEERFSKFLSYDNLFCIDRIELKWNSSFSPSASSSGSLVEQEPVTSPHSEKSLTFNLSALPKDILTSLTVPKSVATSTTSSSQLSHLSSSSSLPPPLPQINPFTIKDVYSFSLADSLSSSYCVIVKPKGLIKLIYPALDSGPVLLLQDLFQRIDFYFSSPVSILDNVNVFLSSDRVVCKQKNKTK